MDVLLVQQQILAEMMKHMGLSLPKDQAKSQHSLQVQIPKLKVKTLVSANKPNGEKERSYKLVKAIVVM